MGYLNGAPQVATFPLAENYRGLSFGHADRVAEEHGRQAFHYRERHLQCVWFDPRWRPPLTTHAGEPVTVRYPGHWNLEAGPDFLGAVLLVGAEERCLEGDVELHISPPDWRHHGHPEDERYRNVIAHVSYLPGVLPANELPSGALQISLQDALSRMPEFSFDAIDIAAYPHGAAAAPTPCSRVLQGLSPDAHLSLLRAAGQERLRLKADRMAGLIGKWGADQALYEGFMAALGYKHNQVPFRRLAALAPVSELLDAAAGDATAVYALLLGAAGLLPRDASPGWDDEAKQFLRSLWDRWWRTGAPWQHRLMDRGEWHLAHLRPTNHPVRRMAAAAALLSRMRGLLAFLGQPAPADAAEWYSRARKLLDSRGDIPFWDVHLSFGSRARPKPVALVGSGRAAAIVSNVFIPFMAAQGHDVDTLLADMVSEDDNSLTRETATALFGRDHNPAHYRDGLLQQGLMQIHHDFCLNRLDGCANCPLPAAIRDHGSRGRSPSS